MLRIEIDHVAANGLQQQRLENVQYLAFLKHFAVAGQGYQPSASRLLRIIGSMLWFHDYMNFGTFSTGRFGQPPALRRDPSAQAQFSNLAGKALADLLAKRLDGALVTFGYEAAMACSDLPIVGARPDLFCITNRRQFAVEAKGLSVASVSDRDMRGHKMQAASGPLPVHFCVAAVSYGIFTTPKCRYHDPVAESNEFNRSLASALARHYYEGWAQILDSGLFDVQVRNLPTGRYYELSMSEDLASSFWLPWIYGRRAPISILIDSRVRKFAERGSWPTDASVIDLPELFVDSDGVGLSSL